MNCNAWLPKELGSSETVILFITVTIMNYQLQFLQIRFLKVGSKNSTHSEDSQGFMIVHTAKTFVVQ